MGLETLLRAAEETTAELVELHCDLIRFPTVNTGQAPTGNETPCAEFCRELLAAEGLEAEVLEGERGRGNLVARRPGAGGGRRLLWMAHLDVVPAGDERRWTSPPFEPEVRGGWVYGRGANDCKSLAASELQALRLLARHRVELRGDVKLALGADEEAGGRHGFGYLAEHHRDRLTAELAINEGGGSPATLADGRPAMFVATGEKGRFEATIRIRGRSEHASLPWLADNPLNRLQEVLAQLAAYAPEIVITPAAEDLLGQVWNEPSPPPERLEAVLARYQQTRPADASRLRSLTRLTIAPTVARAGLKSNAIPDEATLTCDIRALPHQDAGYVERELFQILGSIPGVTVELRTTAEPNATEWTAELAQVIGDSLAAIGQRDVQLLPTLCAGFTDARLVRPLGVPVLGLAPLPPEIALERCGCHNLDEQFPISGLVHRTQFLLALAWHFCR